MSRTNAMCVQWLGCSAVVLVATNAFIQVFGLVEYIGLSITISMRKRVRWVGLWKEIIVLEPSGWCLWLCDWLSVCVYGLVLCV